MVYGPPLTQLSKMAVSSVGSGRLSSRISMLVVSKLAANGDGRVLASCGRENTRPSLEFDELLELNFALNLHLFYNSETIALLFL